MKDQIKMKHVSISLLIMIAVITFFSVNVYADESQPKVMYVKTSGNYVKAYVRGVAPTDDAEYQIGNTAADSPASYSISEDDTPMRTLILLDNSFSIPKASRGKIKELMKGIVEAHGEREEFRIATFSEEINYLSDRYSDDYTALGNMIDIIEHYDQDTRLTDVLYGVIEELNAEDYDGYTRLIIISDGVNNKPVGGITLDRLKKELSETPYPIYTIGSNNGKNDDLLDNLFSLSWDSGCEYLVLEDSDVSDIRDMTSADNSLTVFEAEVPERARTGDRQKSKLTVADGTEVIFDVNTPFSIEEEKEPEVITETVYVQSEDKADEKKSEEVVEEKTDEDGENRFGLFEWIHEHLLIVCIAAGVLGFLIVLLIVLIIRAVKKNKRRRNAAVSTEPEYTGTIILGAEGDEINDGTVHLTPDGGGSDKPRYSFMLTDSADMARSFRCELVDEIRVGRKPDNHIVISDDTSVHGYQCTVSVKNGSFFVTDLKEVKNHAAVNGIQLKPGIPQLVVNNSKITIGRHTYVVSINER